MTIRTGNVPPASTPAAPSAATAPRILRELAAVGHRVPVARKLLLGPDVNFGRELLHALARREGDGWIGWEPATLRRLAEELAFVALADRGLRIASDVETAALVQEALGDAAASASDDFRALADMLGFRAAVRDAVLELRTAGVSPGELRGAARPGTPAHELAAVLEAYEARLAGAGCSDAAGVFTVALEQFDAEAPFALAGTVLVAGSVVTRGLPGRLLERILAAGAAVLPLDRPLGLPAPSRAPSTLAGLPDEGEDDASLLAALHAPELARRDPGSPDADFFAAATPALELREALRRALAEGLRWDQVEIVTTEPDEYGVALDSLCQQLGIGATMLRGVPLRCTRIGRALERWLDWISDGLPADTIRQALEAGEIAAPDGASSSAALAAELRRLRVGWGRARWEAALDRLASAAHVAVRPREDEGEEERARRQAARTASAASLASLVRALLAAAPAVPERGGREGVRASCSGLARATLAFLDLVAVHGAAERLTMERLRTRLERLAAVADDVEPFGVAMAALLDGLCDLRAWPRMTNDTKPWASSGGMVHLTDVAHAGGTGRPRIFFVGLDADRAGGARLQDPLLGDDVRAALGGDRLATTAERRELSRWQLATALASLRGRVTLSFAIAGSDGREAGPAPELLQAFRLVRGDATLSYRDLRAALPPVACAVPDDADASIDDRDAWLGSLADGPLLLDGERAVRSRFPGLDAGLDAVAAATGDPCAHHGVLGDAAAALDVADLRASALSPSALEALAKCPLAWLYRYGASLRAPDDPEYDPDHWLDPLGKGSLLHTVYERFVAEWRERRAEIAGQEAEQRLYAILEEEIERWEAELPPPGAAVFEAECIELRAEARAFLGMERAVLAAGDDGAWAATELGFGDDDGRPVRIDVGEGVTLALRGRIDRVDVMGDGTLRVIDYKTGSSAAFRDRHKHGDFHGGRHLQAALYAQAVEQFPEFAGRRVSRFEYRFPTQKGQGERVVYHPDELARALPIVRDLLGHVRRGEFPPTTDRSDCAWCDYVAVCRVTSGGWSCESPRAAWAADHAEHPVLAPMVLRRRPRGDA